MALRIFFVALAVLGLVVAFQMGRLVLTQKQVFEAPPSYAVGPEDADLEVVEFIDYSCPFCQQIHPTITEAVRRDGKVRYIPKPLPTNNRRSMNAALIAYTAGRQGKFMEAHNFLLGNFPDLTDARLTRMAVDMKLDEDRFNADIRSEEVMNQVMENGELYLRYNTKVTPTFLIGKKMIYVPQGTMPTVEDFLRMFDEARERDK